MFFSLAVLLGQEEGSLLNKEMSVSDLQIMDADCIIHLWNKIVSAQNLTL